MVSIYDQPVPVQVCSVENAVTLDVFARAPKRNDREVTSLVTYSRSRTGLYLN